MNKEKKPEGGPGSGFEHDPDDAAKVGPYNPALGEIYQRLYPEIKRPKPNQEAIAAALRAMQRLTMKMDSETAVEETTQAAAEPSTAPSPSVASAPKVSLPSTPPSTFSAPPNPIVTSAPSPAPRDVSPVSESAPGTHHYHHHYHHHFFPEGNEGAGAGAAAAASTRAASPDSAREADRLRMAAAAKGEPISKGEAAVRRLTQEWILACNTRQLDELLELYAPDALVLRSNLPMLRGAAQIREFFFSALESGLGEVALEPMRVDVVGDLAHEVGRYSALVPGTTGKRREERGKYLWVFAKQTGGEWKLVSECWSSDLTLSSAESDLPKVMTPAVSKVPRK